MRLKFSRIYNEEIIISASSGFFSCCSIILNEVIQYFNYFKKIPSIVNRTNVFEWQKNTLNGKINGDISDDYFINYKQQDIILFNKNISYDERDQYREYIKIDYFQEIQPFIKKYFSPSQQIQTIIEEIENKYSIDYKNTCDLFYRGNDKNTETKICSYDDIIKQAKQILQDKPSIKFLIQSDETEFIEQMRKEFGENTFYFKDEIRHMNKCNSSVDLMYSNTNNYFSKRYLAITLIMSKCEYVICTTGNCSIWILLYRGNHNNVFQINPCNNRFNIF